MLSAVSHFHPYLYGWKYLVRTDHSSLQWLLQFKEPEGQIARWLEKLQQYDFNVAHGAINTHGNADALSRCPCLGENSTLCTMQEVMDQLADTTDKLLARAARVEGPVLPLTTDEEFGNWVWSMAQREDPVLGQVYEWVQGDKRPSVEEVTPFGA